MNLCLQMILFYISISKVNNQEVVRYRKDVCACEELNEKECEYESDWMQGRCNLDKGKCTTRRCQDIHNFDLCRNIGCFVKNNRCYQAKGCNEQTDEECQDIFNFECHYDSDLKRCLSLAYPIDDKTIPTCAERPIDQCYVAREGLCYVKDNKCQELTVCEEVKFDFLCQKTYPGCFMKPTIACITDDKCDSKENPICQMRKQKINGDQYIICKQQEDGSCSNFNSSQENENTCYIKSQLFYHWDGNSCVKCKGQQAGAQEITIYIILILFLINI